MTWKETLTGKILSYPFTHETVQLALRLKLIARDISHYKSIFPLNTSLFNWLRNI